MRIARREFLKLLAEGAAALAVFKLVSLIPSPPRTEIVRPPGAVEEEYFDRLCVRCGTCLEVCPTNAIVLADFSDGIEAVSTPKIEPTVGPCEFFRGRCEDIMRCSRFCPTGALQLVEREEVKIGTVEFSSDRCLAYMGKECVVCNEVCPVHGANTITSDLKPVFHGEKCVGCGICVHSCPAQPKALTLRSKGAKRARWLR